MTSTRPRFFLLTTFGLGHMRPFPGTWGSIPPVLVALALLAIGAGPQQHPLVFNGVMLAIVLAFSHVCVHQGDLAEAWFGRKDPSEVVADETAGQALVLLLLPLAQPHDGASWAHAIALLGVAFVSFRVLDILKPWPARGLQRIAGGWGVLIDDLVVAIPAWGIVQAVGRVLLG